MRAQRRSPGAARQARRTATAPEYPASATTVTFTARRGRRHQNQALRRPKHHAQRNGRHDRRHLGLLHRQGGRNQKVHHADAGRTGSGRRVQRDAHRHRRMGQHHHELLGRKDAHLERTRHRARFGKTPEYPVSATTVTFANGVGTAKAKSNSTTPLPPSRSRSRSKKGPP